MQVADTSETSGKQYLEHKLNYSSQHYDAAAFRQKVASLLSLQRMLNFQQMSLSVHIQQGQCT